ncbi:hypothetical protein [Parasediminibacterium sp. JCM 36343]|uniref:hypothetical protein n=1 Tax=Parasediminibacterium sp. JCM 36343 TaxID=3374279 RepID=UPI0039793FCB
MRFDTLLSDLSESSFDSLIKLQQLKADGWQVHYVIDADLIGNYCFPRGIIKENERRAKNRNLTEEYIFDEQATLFNLFKSQFPSPQCIILDEYVLELRGMTRVALAAEKLAFNDAEILVNKWVNKSKDFVNLNLEYKELRDDISKNFSLRIAEVLLGVNGLKKFEFLISQKLITFEVSPKLPNFFYKLFEEEKGEKEEIDKIFRVFVDVSNTVNPSSRDRDSKAIQRIIAINRRIQKKEYGSEHKHIFLFVTDAPSITQIVMDKLFDFDIIDYPYINNEKISLYTTTQEIFAHLMCAALDNENKGDYSKTIKKLQTLKKISTQINNKLNATSHLIGEIRNYNNNDSDYDINDLFNGEYKAFFSNYNSIRNSFENTGLFKNMNNSIYDDVIKMLSERGSQGLLNYFSDIKSNQTQFERNFQERHKLLDRLVDEVDFNSRFITGIEEIRCNTTSFEWSKGIDNIEGTYQILPVFLQLKNYKAYGKEINKLIKLVLGDEKKDDSNIYDTLKDLITTLTKIKSEQEYQIDQQLLKALIFLILPNSNIALQDRNAVNKDIKVFKWLNKIKKNLVKTDIFYADFLYILCWVTRRIKRYEESIELAFEGIRNFPDDPRFYHGFALTKYCTIYEDPTLLQIDEIIENINISESKYMLFFKKYYSTEDGYIYFKKLLDCNSNNTCVLFTEKACLLLKESEGEELLLNKNKTYTIAMKFIKEARNRLNKLKINGKFKTELSEYYDTEATLEFMESFFIKDFDIHFKLEKANEAISYAVELTTKQELKLKYIKTKEKIDERIDLLYKNN